MKKHTSYPKIQQFRNVVADISRLITFVSVDKNGDGVYDPSIKKPIIRFRGTVKLHGTNSGVCFNSTDGFWIQSRTNIITVEKDNAGFARFVEENKEELIGLINNVIEANKIDTTIYTVSIFGEWAGKGIQKGVGISEIEKAFFIFGVKVSNLTDPDFKSYWLDSSTLRCDEKRIFNIDDFKVFYIDVDFNLPQLSQNKFIEITESVENECPVAKAFGIENGLGEGVVWSATYKNEVHRFKVKGEKHSVSKVKKLASVDVEKLESIVEFVNYSVTENRYNQAIENVFNDGELDIKKMGDYIRWMVNDITKEEMDTMVENNLVPKDVNKHISTKAREMFLEAFNKF